MLVCWGFIYTLEIITRTFCEVVNRERLCGTSTFFCLFVCFIDKTKTVKRLGRFHSRILSFTQDGPAFSTKTTQRALQVAKVCNLQVDELAWLSRSAEHADLTKDAKPHTRRLLTHLIGPPTSSYWHAGPRPPGMSSGSVCWFVCLFVGMNPEKLYSASFFATCALQHS